MKKLLYLFAVAVMLSLASCEGKEEGMPQTAVASIVTYESTVNGVSTFSYTDNRGDLITLAAKWGGKDDLKAGARVLIYYTAEQYGVSGDIALLGVTRIPGGTPKTVPGVLIPESEPLQQCAVWRSGNYLNLSSTITIEGNPDEISLYIDEATARLQIPTAYVVVTPADYSTIGVERTLYASWDISKVLSAPDCEGLKVVYTNSANQPTVIKIEK